MKSRTSFSKLTIFKKNLTRFAPVWALYLIGMMLVIIESGHYSDYDRYANYLMDDLVGSFGIVNIIYAGVIALALYGDLYNTRMCYSLHTIPMRRDGLLLSNLLAGLCFSVVPNTMAALYMMTRLGAYWFLALYWLLAVTIQFLFFYGIATISAMLTGNRVALLVVYALFNFVAMLIYGVTQVLYVPMMHGVVVDVKPFMQLSPCVQLVNEYSYFLFEEYEETYMDMGMDGMLQAVRTRYRYTGLGTGWGYHGILAALGLASAAVSLWLYRLRHLESAGDFVSFSKTKGVLCVVLTICVALCMALLGEAFATSYAIWLAVGLFVGFFGSLMLLERRVKVFRKKTFLGFGIMALVTLISCLAVAFDWFGIVTWTPQADRVESVTIANYKSSNYDYNGYGMDPNYYGNRISVTLTKENEIAEIITAHEDILEHLEDLRDENGNYKPTHYVVISYKMKGGRTTIRAYSALTEGINYNIVSKYFYTPERVLGYTDPVQAANGVQYIYGNNGEIDVECAEKLFKALQLDCENGFVLPQVSGVDKTGFIEYHIRNGNTVISRTLYLLPGATNTMAVLNSPETMMGYKEWNKYLYNIEYVNVQFETIKEDHHEGLLTALRTDIEMGYVSGIYSYQDVIVTIEVFDGRNYKQFYITKEAVNVLSYLNENEIPYADQMK